jgi:hypothetical protein
VTEIVELKNDRGLRLLFERRAGEAAALYFVVASSKAD